MRKTCDERLLILKQPYFCRRHFAMFSKRRPRLVNPTFIFTAEFAESLADFNRKAFRRFEPRLGRDYHFLKNLTLPRHLWAGWLPNWEGSFKLSLYFYRLVLPAISNKIISGCARIR